MGARRCPFTPGTFRALRWADGAIYIRCDACRRYIELLMTTDIAERQVKRTTFSCVDCGAIGSLTGDDPARRGYRLDPRDRPRRHPLATARLQGRLGGSSYGRRPF